MTTTQAEAQALTRDNLKALRAADSAVFRWKAGPGGFESATLDLSKEAERSDGFGRETLHVVIPTDARVQNYGGSMCGDDSEWRLEPATEGSWVLLSVKFKPEWGTFTHLLKVGDRLCQRWTVDNRNELLKHAGLTAHELAVEVVRDKPKNQVRLNQNPEMRLFFMLDTEHPRAGGLGESVRRKP